MYVVKLKTILFFSIILFVSIVIGACGVNHFKDNTPKIGAVETFGETNSVDLPIIMYHGLTKKDSNVNTYFIPVSSFENDLKYLKENGYTTVLMKDVIDYIDGNSELPDKPIMLAFDDGFKNNLEYGFSLLEKYDMKAIISIVGKYSEDFSDIEDDNPEYAYLTWDDIKKLNESGRIEIGNHSYDMHMLPKEKENKDKRKGASQVLGESDEEYKKKLVEDTKKTQDLLEKNCGITPTFYTYPYGEVCKMSEETMKELGFHATITCMDKTNYINVNNHDSLFCLVKMLRTDKNSVTELLSNSH